MLACALFKKNAFQISRLKRISNFALIVKYKDYVVCSSAGDNKLLQLSVRRSRHDGGRHTAAKGNYYPHGHCRRTELYPSEGLVILETRIDMLQIAMAGWTGANIHLDGATTVDNHLWLVVELAMSVLVQQIHEHLAKVLAGLQVRAFVSRYSEERLDDGIPNREGLNHFDTVDLFDLDYHNLI